MKRHSAIYILLLAAAITVSAQTVVHIDNPEIWKSSEMNNYIGKTVKFDQPFYICNNYYYSQGNYTIAPRRIYSPTNQAIPMSNEYMSIVSANSTGSVTLNGLNDYHRMGERLTELTVRVTSANNWQLVSAKFEGNTREDMSNGHPSVDIRGEHNLLVCSFNLEYYLVENLGQGSMGPSTKEMQNRQHTKIMEALKMIQADIFGFVEVEQGQGALEKLARSLTQETGRKYTWINDKLGANGTYTKSGYVYCEETVEPVGELRKNETGVKNRKRMQAFRLKTGDAAGETFIFSLNHFKAKSGSGTGLDADQGDGQGIFNNTRTKEAQSVLSDYGTNKNYYEDEDLLIMGDLNAYAKEDPIQTLVNGGMTDLHRYFHADSSYSYTYRGQAGYLDHALANSTMLAQVTGMTAYHINSDEDDGFTYNGRTSDLTMFRCSDHDPILVGLRLGSQLETECRVEIIDDNFTILDAQEGYYRIYNMTGMFLYEGKITDSMFTLPALPQGLIFINIYSKGAVKQVKIMNIR